MRILLAEDVSTKSPNIEPILTHANLDVYCTNLDEEALDLAKLYDYDLILLNLTLPDMNGLNVLRQLRMARVQTPVLILSVCREVNMEAQALNEGADDYQTKPLNHKVLVARIHAIIRRSQGHAQSIISTGKVSINLDAKTVDVSGRPVHLTDTEYRMFELLNLRKGTTLTREMFLNHLYSGIDEPQLKNIDAFVYRLRKKLSEAMGSYHYIETVRGRGYVLRDPPPEETEVVA